MTDEVAGVEFAGVENDGLENDGVEQEQTYAFKVIRVLIEGIGATVRLQSCTRTN